MAGSMICTGWPSGVEGLREIAAALGERSASGRIAWWRCDCASTGSSAMNFGPLRSRPGIRRGPPRVGEAR